MDGNEHAPPGELTMDLGARVAEALRGRDYDAARALVAAAAEGTAGDPRSHVTAGEPPPNWDRPVFVCGLHRSGTTLLTRFLESDYDVASLTGAKSIEGEGQFLQDVYPMERPYGGPGSFAFFRQMQLDPVTNARTAKATARRLMGQWGSHFRGGAVPLEKSPPNLVRIAYLRSLFPKARFVILTRDPRAVSMATRKWSKSPLHELMLHWSVAHMVALRDMREDCHHLRYEDFCEDPAGHLSRIAEFCDLTPRAESSGPGRRFAEVSNSNGKYLAEWPGVTLDRLSVRPWEFFGYAFDPKDGVGKDEAKAGAAKGNARRKNAGRKADKKGAR